MAKKTESKVLAEKPTADEGKLKALGLAMDQITKQFGDGSIMKLGEAKKVDVELLPSGALSLDIALGGEFDLARPRAHDLAGREVDVSAGCRRGDGRRVGCGRVSSGDKSITP